jgi:hypothetical protein
MPDRAGRPAGAAGAARRGPPRAGGARIAGGARAGGQSGARAGGGPRRLPRSGGGRLRRRGGAAPLGARVQLVRKEGRGACPVSTEGGTRRVQLVRRGGGRACKADLRARAPAGRAGAPRALAQLGEGWGGDARAGEWRLPRAVTRWEGERGSGPPRYLRAPSRAAPGRDASLSRLFAARGPGADPPLLGKKATLGSLNMLVTVSRPTRRPIAARARTPQLRCAGASRGGGASRNARHHSSACTRAARARQR